LGFSEIDGSFKRLAIYKNNSEEIWAKPLYDGAWAVGFLNRDNDQVKNISLDVSELGLDGHLKVWDLWKHQDLEVNHSGQITLTVKPHECRVMKITLKK